MGMKKLFLCIVLLFLGSYGEGADTGDAELKEIQKSPAPHASAIVIDLETQSSVENREPSILRFWLGRTIRILGKPIMAIGSGLTYKVASTMGDPSLGIPGITAIAVGALMDRIGIWTEDVENSDSFLGKNNCFKRGNEMTAAVYNILGKYCSFAGLPFVIVGGVTYTYGHNANDILVTNIGIVMGATGMALHTLGSELEKLVKETKEELTRFEERNRGR